MSHKRGIYLVANLPSQQLCENLIYSIRQSGCLLPIRVIHFGGSPVNSEYILSNAELVHPESFSKEATDYINNLQSVLNDCPRGFLHRFLAWFGDWDEFIYSDNDIVALCNWEVFFDHLQDNDVVHADEEYTTEGRYNYLKPQAVEDMFGKGSLLSAFTAGHFAAKRNEKIIKGITQAIEWFRQNPSIPKKHDQALLHVASLIGEWKMVNLCREPYNWLSSWAGDYKNSLELILKIQQIKTSPSISHLHYSGGQPSGTKPIEDLLFASSGTKPRLNKIITAGLKEISGLSYMLHTKKRVVKRLKKGIK